MPGAHLAPATDLSSHRDLLKRKARDAVSSKIFLLKVNYVDARLLVRDRERQ